VELSGDDPVTQAALAQAEASAGKTAAARKRLENLLNAAQHRYVSACHLAEIYLALGKKEQAYKWLSQAYQNRDIELAWARVNPTFDSLRRESKFSELIKAVNPALL